MVGAGQVDPDGHAAVQLLGGWKPRFDSRLHNTVGMVVVTRLGLDLLVSLLGLETQTE